MFARRLILCALVALIPARASAQIEELLGLDEPKPQQKPKPTRKRPPPKKTRTQPKKSPPAASGRSVLDELGGLEGMEQKGRLVVKVVGPADGAAVTVNGKPVKAGEPVEVEPGEHQVAVKRPGWSEASRSVSVTGGGQTEVSIALDAVAGVLDVTADVPGSTVLIDGKPAGTAPVAGLLVSPGMHEVTVRREGYEDHTSRLAIRAGRDYQVKANLRPQEGSTRRLAAVDGDRPEAPRLMPDAQAGATNSLDLQPWEEPSAGEAWYGRWYVWAGVGAVAVAAATTGVLVARSGSAQGPPSPAEVCRRECDAVINGPAAALGRLGSGGFRLGR